MISNLFRQSKCLVRAKPKIGLSVRLRTSRLVTHKQIRQPFRHAQLQCCMMVLKMHCSNNASSTNNNSNTNNNEKKKPLVIDPCVEKFKSSNNTTAADSNTSNNEETIQYALHNEASPIDYTEIYRERTEVTSSLWRLRENLVQKQQKATTKDTTRAPLREKHASDSLIEVNYSFKDNPNMRNEYTRFDGGVRLEKILEDMDALAGNVAQIHSENDDNYPISFVTASVDRIDMQRRMPMNRNLIMQGRMVYVGNTSCNVRISIFDKNNSNYIICNAFFIMVAQDDNPHSTMYRKSVPINKLKIESDLDKQLYLRGKFDSELRKQHRNSRLSMIPPTQAELEIIHNIWLDSRPDLKRNFKHNNLTSNRNNDNNNNNGNSNNNIKQIENIMDTRVEHTTICQPQEMNRAGKIFGGFLMKGAYELARSCAYKFSGGTQDLNAKTFNIDKHAVFVSSDEISFEYPVSVGSIIMHEAMVACTDLIDYKPMNNRNSQMEKLIQRHCMCIVVRTRIQEPGSNTPKMSNLFTFVFVTPAKVLNQVLPTTYEESMLYLHGRRALHQTSQIALRDGNLLAQFID